MKNKAVLSIAFFVLAIAAVGVYILGIIPESVMLVVIGVLGFSGVGALRSFIDVQGWKTWGSVALGVVGLVLYGFNVFTPDMLAKWMTFWGIAAFSGIAHAIKKFND